MTGYLVDTSVLSITAPGRRDATPEFVDWIATKDRELFLSAVTAAEVERGIAKLLRAGAKARAEAYRAWFDQVLEGFGPNTIALDSTIARLAGRMQDNADATGHPTGLADILIAATARSRDLLVLTRNLKHFLPLGVEAIDPLQALSR